MASSSYQELFLNGGVVRKLWSVEAEAYGEHLLRLDGESRRQRFEGVVDNEIIRTYAATSRGSDVVIHGFFVDGVLRGAADLRILGPFYRREGEVALSVEKEWQSQGIGSALLARTLLAARNRGIRHLYVCCPPGNQVMRRLVSKLDAEFTSKLDTIIGKIDNALPTPLSVMRELVVDGHSFAAAAVDYQARLFKPTSGSK